MASDQGAGHPRLDGKAEEEPIVELSATTTTPPAGMRGPASRAAIIQGSPRPEPGIPASARTCWTPRTSRRRRGTPAAPEGRWAGSAAPARNREVWRRGRPRGGRRDHRDHGACPGLLVPDRTGTAARYEPWSAARR